MGRPVQINQKAAGLLNFSKKRLVIIGVVVLLAIVIIIGVVFSRRGKQATQPPVGKIPEPTAVVTITKDGFVPSTLTIKKGQTVKWVNNIDSPHRVASDPYPTHTGLPGFDSGNNLDKGSTYVFNFQNTGTFGYHDHLNPQTIKGVITVQ